MCSLEHKVKLPDLTGPGLLPAQDCWAPSAIPRPFSTPLLLRLGIQRMAGWGINLLQRMCCLLPVSFLYATRSHDPKVRPGPLALGERNYCLVLVRSSLSRPPLPLLRLWYGGEDCAK